jgi:hypothetical protein
MNIINGKVSKDKQNKANEIESLKVGPLGISIKKESYDPDKRKKEK